MSFTTEDVRKAVGTLRRLGVAELFDGYFYDANGVVMLTKGAEVVGFAHPDYFQKIAEPYSGDAGDETQ